MKTGQVFTFGDSAQCNKPNWSNKDLMEHNIKNIKKTKLNLKNHRFLSCYFSELLQLTVDRRTKCAEQLETWLRPEKRGIITQMPQLIYISLVNPKNSVLQNINHATSPQKTLHICLFLPIGRDNK